MYYLVLLAVWVSGLACGVVLAIGMREYFLRRPGALPEVDAHERSAWPVERG